MSTQTTHVKAAKGRWLILDRLAAGCRALAAGGVAWAGARDVNPKEDGVSRGRAAAARIVGGTLSVAFVAGTLWALSRGVLLWGSTALWLIGAWVAGRPADEEEEWPALADESDALTADEFVELLHQLSAGRNLHLSTVRSALERVCPGGDWSGPAVTALCEEVGARVRKGVSVPGATPRVTTGIHRDDLPPLPSPTGPAPVAVLTSNNNDNNNTNTHPDGVVIVPDMMQGARR